MLTLSVNTGSVKSLLYVSLVLDWSVSLFTVNQKLPTSLQSLSSPSFLSATKRVVSRAHRRIDKTEINWPLTEIVHFLN